MNIKDFSPYLVLHFLPVTCMMAVRLSIFSPLLASAFMPGVPAHYLIGLLSLIKHRLSCLESPPVIQSVMNGPQPEDQAWILCNTPVFTKSPFIFYINHYFA